MNAGFEYLDAKDQTSVTKPRARGERLVRLGDAADPDRDRGALPLRRAEAEQGRVPKPKKKRTIAGHRLLVPPLEAGARRRLPRRLRGGQVRHTSRPTRARRRSTRSTRSSTSNSREASRGFNARTSRLRRGENDANSGPTHGARHWRPSRSPRLPARGPDGPDQRRRRDVPVPDLLEVVLRVQQAPPRRRDQLPVDRLGRRHPAAHQPDRLLRRDRRADDRRAALGGARARSSTSRRCSAASCRSTTSRASTPS